MNNEINSSAAKLLENIRKDWQFRLQEKITAPEGARFPVGRLVARLLPECCIARCSSSVSLIQKHLCERGLQRILGFNSR